MKIVHVAAEFAPIAKAGGLGDVMVGLARESVRLKEDVTVILPKYDFIDLKQFSQVEMEIPDFKCWENGHLYPNAAWSALVEKVNLKFIDVRHPSGYFHRGKIYGCQDDIARFLYFARAVCEYLKLRNEAIDLLHLHDWHVAAVALFARDLFSLPVKAIVLTIHNAEYQGRCAPWDLDAVGLDGQKYLSPKLLQDDFYKDSLNLLKGGIVYADWVTTVSPTYAKEMLQKAKPQALLPTPTPSTQSGKKEGSLQPLLWKHRKKFSGILNGLDLAFWEPGFGLKDKIDRIKALKKKEREHLAKKCNLSAASEPWVGAITRLVFQKGPELIEAALRETVRLKGTFLLLASPSTPEVQHHFESLRKEYEKTGQVFIFLEYDDALAHSLYKSLNFLVLPSRYEPCGLAQMIAMHHATIPIARATGGHIDTIDEGATGYLFSDYSPEAMKSVLQRAISDFHTHPVKIDDMMLKGVAKEWSWKEPTKEYLALYKKLISLKPS